MAHEKVLLVDDEPDFVSVLKERLSARGLDVSTAGSGPAAVEEVKRKRFDVVILDYNMPGMDGIETLKSIVALDKEVQVLLLTGHATARTGADAIRHGAADFLEKPADLPDLLAKIGDAAARRMSLVEEHSADQIEDILKKRGW
jgi:DNA-binding NtrC family response regulator